MELYEWTKHNITYKDSMKKQILKQTFNENNILVEEKKGKKHYYINEQLQKISKYAKEKETIYLICSNTKENIEELYKSWEQFIANRKLTIIFANPETNQSWLIHPRTHEFISDREKIEEGFQTLHKGIEVLE